MSEPRAIGEARAAFARGAWLNAYQAFVTADAQAPLDPEDLDRLATAAYLTGHDEASVAARTRAHNGYLDRDQPIRAAAAAFWLVFTISDNPSQRAQATGWLARAHRLVEDARQPCAEEGWLLCARGYFHVVERDIASARAAFARAAEIGARFQNRDLLALARLGHGRCLLVTGNAAEGLALLDEIMVAVTNGEIAPMVAGVVYCSVISACHDIFDLRRAHEWTIALQSWCASQPDLVPFRGFCQVRRSELLQFHGNWEEAVEEARRACGRASAASRPEAGAAHYQLAELLRVRGLLAGAEDAYRAASQAGRKPYPGLALLRLSQGQPDAAEASIRLALQETREPRGRVPLLCAAVDILLAGSNLPGAEVAARELADIARRFESRFVRAVSAQAGGAVKLAAGDPTAALDPLRDACTTWQELDAPYELARVRMLIGLAYRQLGDRDGAQLEFEAAQEGFERLGAAPDASRAATLAAERPQSQSGGLTGREVEVLRLLATGVTNRVIASRLGISEKTVARHISNIFTKLDLPSRAAATAYAYEHKLI